MNPDSNFDRACEYAGIPLAPRTTPEPARPSLHAVDRINLEKAARVIERCNFEVTGLVLTHRALPKKSIVDAGHVRWFPNMPDFMSMMTGRKDTVGPGVPPPEAIGDEVLAQPVEPASAPPIQSAVPSSAPARPVLTAPPSARLLESTEEALGALAAELGCVRNDLIPHNAGWFVPGTPTAYASAYDAVKGLVESLKNGGTVYKTTADTSGAEAGKGRQKAVPEPAGESVQGGLF